jgi:hypothetical protein
MIRFENYELSLNYKKWRVNGETGMCSRRILRELVMHMLVSTNGVNVYGESTYTKIQERQL